MWIKSLIIACILGIISSLSAVETTGFRDMKWGDSPKALGSQAVLSYEDKIKNITSYTRKDEKLLIGDIKLEEIDYKYFDNKLYEIVIQTSDENMYPKNFTTHSLIVKNLLNVFISKFGKYSKITSEGVPDEKYLWEMKGNTKIQISSHLGGTTMGPFAWIINTKILKESEDYIKQKSVNDL